VKATIHLFDHLLQQGRKDRALGRNREALLLFARLSRFGSLPTSIAEETQLHLAELHLRQRRYARARKHLGVLLSWKPDHPRYHYLMAACWHVDQERGDLEQAAEHYRRSLELAPEQVKCLADFGLLCLRLGRVEEGLEKLQTAHSRAPDDPRILNKRVKGLLHAGQAEEAREVLRAARFRSPHSTRVGKLYNDFHFQEVRRQQASSRLTQSSDLENEQAPVLLPFHRPVHPPVSDSYHWAG
jgi:Tfp pilus assembly protein PilF